MQCAAGAQTTAIPPCLREPLACWYLVPKLRLGTPHPEAPLRESAEKRVSPDLRNRRKRRSSFWITFLLPLSPWEAPNGARFDSPGRREAEPWVSIHKTA